MTDLGKAFRQDLEESAGVSELAAIKVAEAKDGTIKWMFSVGERSAIETVYIPEPRRATLCISSQAGCALDCSFCATGAQGFQRNLSTGEIIGQLWSVKRWLAMHRPEAPPVTNIVYMGMGEPLLNLKAVIQATQLMIDDRAYGLSRHKVTISTSGIVPNMIRLRDQCRVALAVSLHAPTNALRDQIVPINRTYPLETLIEACRHYLAPDRKDSITFEYVLIRGINDHPDHARALVRLLSRIPCKINLIPFNPFPQSEYRRPEASSVEKFQNILISKGFLTLIRRTRGDDISAACGQLVGQIMDKRRHGLHKAEVINAI